MLEKAGVLTATKEGRTVFYEVRYKHLTDAFRALAKAIDGCRPKRKSAKSSS
jgi:ArsR family transcriptional regulator, arsenate/arsenite/antimonite-responsive transcriptional repressor